MQVGQLESLTHCAVAQTLQQRIIMSDDSGEEFKHEALMDSRDFVYIYNQYDRGAYKDVTNPLTLLLIAKACFFKQQYDDCFKVLQQINKDTNTKILYQKQALLLKLTYLREPQSVETLDRIVRDYDFARSRCPGKSLTAFHYNSIQSLKEVVAEGEKLALTSKSVDKLEFKGKIENLQERKRFEGMPCYLISSRWNKAFAQFMHRDGKYPGPITNFELMNHVFEFQPHTEPQLQYMNTITFPYVQGKHYQTVNRRHWQLLYSTFSGYPIKRVNSLDPKDSRKGYGYDSVSRVLLQCNGHKSMMQWQIGTYWEKSVLPSLARKFGPGQLKQLSSNKTYMILRPGRVHQPSTLIKYVQIDVTEIAAANNIQSLRKTNLVNSYDLEKYKPEQCSKKSTIGLANLGNTCYMNSALQSLCNLQAFVNYFVVNRYLKKINLSDSNKDGSYGEVTCAFADLVKKLWFGNNEVRYIDPTVFKKTFGTRFPVFQGYEQQDAQEFLLFMLNCMHQDLNENNQMSVGQRESVTGKAFENARNIALNHYHRHNKSIISEMFNSFHYHEIRCEECEFTNYRFDNYMMVGLQVPPDKPLVSLFYVGPNNLAEALKIEVVTSSLSNVQEVIDMVRKHLNISEQNQVHAMMYSSDFKDSQDIGPEEEVKYVQKQSSKGKLLFLYEVPRPAEGQQVCAITYTCKKGSSDVVRDGFPRILCLSQSLFEEANEAELRKIVYQIMPKRKQNDDQSEVIEGFKHKKIKSTCYEVEHRVSHRKDMKLYDFTTQQEKLGNEDIQKSTKLQDLLQNYSTQEAIDESEKWFCQNCKQVRKARKTDRIYALGKYLMIHLKRFTETGKIFTRIEYPICNLDMSRFVHEDVRSRSPNLYDLQAVVLHMGSLNSGHYTCVSRNIDKTEWLEFDDDAVRPKDESTVVDSNAYILVYQRMDPLNVYESRKSSITRP